MPVGPSSTASRLMDAAERLVAVHGDDGASSRAITLAAGQRSNSAITYHFGNRRGLLEAVWTRGSAAVEARRRQMIDRLPSNPGLVDLSGIYIKPLASYLDTKSPSYWARYNEHALREYPLQVLPGLRDNIDAVGRTVPLHTLLDVFEQMRQLSAASGSRDCDLGLSAGVRMVIAMFAAWEREAEAGRERVSASRLGDSLIDLIVACLS